MRTEPLRRDLEALEVWGFWPPSAYATSAKARPLTRSRGNDWLAIASFERTRIIVGSQHQ